MEEIRLRFYEGGGPPKTGITVWRAGPCGTGPPPPRGGEERSGSPAGPERPLAVRWEAALGLREFVGRRVQPVGPVRGGCSEGAPARVCGVFRGF